MAWRGWAWLAGLGKARLGKARLGKARHGWAWLAWLGWAGRGWARHGWLGGAGRGWARLGKARQGRLGWARRVLVGRGVAGRGRQHFNFLTCDAFPERHAAPVAQALAQPLGAAAGEAPAPVLALERGQADRQRDGSRPGGREFAGLGHAEQAVCLDGARRRRVLGAGKRGGLAGGGPPDLPPEAAMPRPDLLARPGIAPFEGPADFRAIGEIALGVVVACRQWVTP